MTISSPSKPWTKQQTDDFIVASEHKLADSALSASERLLLEAELAGASAYLRYLESQPK